MLESYYENKLRTGVQKLGNGVRCLKFESPVSPVFLTGSPTSRCKGDFCRDEEAGKMERKRQLYVQGLLRALGFEVFSAVDSVEKIEAVLARCREVLRDEGILPA